MIIIRIIIGLAIILGGIVIGGTLCKVPLGWVFGLPISIGGIIMGLGIIIGGPPKGGHFETHKQEHWYDNI